MYLYIVFLYTCIALQNGGISALRVTTPISKESMSQKFYSKTAELIDLVNKYINIYNNTGNPDITLIRPPSKDKKRLYDGRVIDEEYYNSKLGKKEVPLEAVMKLLQKNYDAQKNFGQQNEDRIRVHIIKNPEVLERFRQSLRNAQLDRSTSSSSESTDEDYFDRTLKALLLRRNSVNFRLSSDVSSEATKEEAEVTKVTERLPKSVEDEVTPFKLPFEYDEIKNMEILINSEEFKEADKKKSEENGQNPTEEDAWDFITKNYKWGVEKTTEKSVDDPNWENTKRRETANNWDNKDGDWHKKSNDWDQKDKSFEKKDDWNKKSDDWNMRENSWEKKDDWNKKADDHNKKSEDWNKKNVDWNKKANSWEKKDDWNKKSDDRNKKTDDWNKKSDDRNKKTDDWNKKQDDWNKKPDDWNKKSDDWNKKSNDWNEKPNDWHKKTDDWDKKSDDWHKKSDTYKNDNSWDKKDNWNKKNDDYTKKSNDWNRENNWDVKGKKTTEDWNKRDNNWNREDNMTTKNKKNEWDKKDNWDEKWDLDKSKDTKKKKDTDDWNTPKKDDDNGLSKKDKNDWNTWTTKDDTWDKKRDSWDKRNSDREKSVLRINKKSSKENDFKSSEQDKTKALDSFERDATKNDKVKKTGNEWDNYTPKNDDYYKPKRSKRVDSYERNDAPAAGAGHSFGRTPIPFAGKKRIYDK